MNRNYGMLSLGTVITKHYFGEQNPISNVYFRKFGRISICNVKPCIYSSKNTIILVGCFILWMYYNCLVTSLMLVIRWSQFSEVQSQLTSV